MESRDRHLVARRICEHCQDVKKHPLLVGCRRIIALGFPHLIFFPLFLQIFPEGTCVNNEYVVMFKRGAFDLGTSIVPVAIKYNHTFTDAFWNSRKQSFALHLFKLMTSWALVVDVYYLEPQYKREGETSAAFAARVKEMIAK